MKLVFQIEILSILLLKSPIYMGIFFFFFVIILELFFFTLFVDKFWT